MRTIKTIIAILLYFPTIIPFIIIKITKLVFNILNGLHPLNFRHIILPSEIDVRFLENGAFYFFIKILVLIFSCIEEFFSEIKEIFTYKFLF